MKTLKFIAPELSGSGGTETVFRKVLLNLSKDYHIILYLTNQPADQTWLKDLRANSNIEIHHCNGDKLSKLIYLSDIFIKSHRNDHFIISGANIIPFAAKIRRLFHRHYRITSWIHYSLDHQSMFDLKAITQADDHWAISSAIKRSLEQLGVSSNRIKLVYNPIKPVSEINQPDQSGPLKLVYVGRLQLYDQKNLSELLQAVNTYHSNMQLTLFGRAKDQEIFEKAVINSQHDSQAEIRIHQWTPDPWSVILDDVHPQALVLTSKFEGLPMVMLEAISRGIPVITSKFDGYDDVIQEKINGVSYQSGNIKELQKCFDLVQSINWNSRDVKQSINKFYDDQYFKHVRDVLKESESN